jgi:tetratricopeptide (TPR) repeat protein
MSDAGEARYQLLVAEIAATRRDLATAARAYLEAGRLSGDMEALRRAAGLAYGTRDFELAEQAAAVWIERAPDDPLALRYQLSVAMQRGAVDEAAGWYVALRDDATVSDDLLLEWLRQTPEPATTLQMLAQLGAERPDDRVLLLQALQLGLQWQDDTAVLGASARLIAAGEADDEVLIARSQALERTQGAATALEALEDLDAASASTDLLRRRGELRFATGDYDGVRVDLERVLAATPGDAMVLYLVGEVELMQQQLDQADLRFGELRELPGMRDLGSFMLGRVARERGELQPAIVLFDSVSKQDLRLQAQMAAAAVEIELGRLDAAMRRTDELALRNLDAAAGIQRDRAALLADAGYTDRARVLYQDLLQTAPDDRQLRYGLALVQAQAGETDAAVVALEALLAEAPDSADYMNALGYTLADAGRELPRARELVAGALASAPDSPSILDSMGWIEFKLGDLQAALALLERAWALDQDPEIAAHLGEVLWTLGRQPAARSIWDAAAATRADHAVLRATRARLDPDSADVD